MDENDYVVDDLFAVKTKKIKSGPKGKRGELWIVKLLNKRFDAILSKNLDWGKFSRTVGSGNRTGQKVCLSNIAKLMYTSDLVCPPTFKFSIESKCGYNNIDMCSFFENGNKEIDIFLKQVENDSGKIHREPLLIWKKDYKPALAFFKNHIKYNNNSNYKMFYKDWIIINFKNLLELDDAFFFE